MAATRKKPLISTHVFIFASAMLALLAVGCPSTAPLAETPNPSQDGETPGAAAAKTLVGQVEDSLALVGMIHEEDKLIAYVCDGDDGPRSISQWYEGALGTGGLFWLEPSGGYGADTGYGAGPDGPASPLWGILQGDRATGLLLDADGRTTTWVADQVSGDGAAGVYIGDDGDAVASLVVLNEQFALGLARDRATQARIAVQTPARMPPGAPIVVHTAGRAVTTTAVRSPIDLRATGVVEPRNSPPPKAPAVSDQPPPAIKLPAPPNTIQIKFREGLRVRLARGADRPADENGRALVSRTAVALLNEVSRGVWARAHVVDERTLDALRESGQRRSGKPLPDLNLYFNLQLPAEMRAAEIVAKFRRLPEVEWAAIMPDYYLADAPNLQDPNPVSASSPYQRYLDPAPVGVDARYAWGLAGGDGAGVKIVDIELAYNAAHVDLPDVANVTAPISTDPAAIDHGTATLGVIAGLDDAMGVTGIAHGAEVYFTAVFAGPEFALVQTLGLDGFLVYSIVANELEPGDVLVLEQQVPGPMYNPADATQYGLLPPEWNKPVFDAIRIATANGLVVVEAAGNGYQNLDSPIYRSDPAASHQPFRVDNGQRANDSGAIIVGAGVSGSAWSRYPGVAPRQRHAYSNYGGRVDLFAWGDAVVTAGNQLPQLPNHTPYDGGVNATYRDDYAGTSSATAIMGGVVASFQGFHKEFFGTAYSPSGLRTWLRATGTPQEGNVSQNIGRMPNLRAAIEGAMANFGPPAPPPDPELVQLGCEMPEIYYPDSDCVAYSPLPAPSWSLPSGPLSQEDLAFVRPIFPSPWPASSLIQYTLDGSLPKAPDVCNADASCATRHWVPVMTNNCVSIAGEVSQFTAPLICRARLWNEAICEPDAASPIVTRVYVPEGFIKPPQFDRGTAPVTADLRIDMRTGYPSSYPDGYAFVAYSLDGTTPVFGPQAPGGVNSRVWTDAHDNQGLTIAVFANTAQNVVTLKARNYLVIAGEYVPGDVVEWTYVR